MLYIELSTLESKWKNYINRLFKTSNPTLESNISNVVDLFNPVRKFNNPLHEYPSSKAGNWRLDVISLSVLI